MNIRGKFQGQNLSDVYNLFREKWWNSNSNVQINKKDIDLNEKKIREKRFDNLIDKLVNHIYVFDSNKDIKVWNDNLYEIINAFLVNGYIFNIDFEEKLKNDFFKVTKNFVKEAKRFDENIGINDIGQAMRNVWIINILQAIKGEKVELSKAIFGYSMLYPYTDNYLDNAKISINNKKQFNNRLTERLEGKSINPNDEHERKVYKLIENIEEVFDRKKHNKVYESLMEIQNGQVASLNQQDEITIPYERDILGISIEKGGSSVLVDGYLINGELTLEELEFCIGYGMLLQFADDLQDVKEDLVNNHMTIMSQLSGHYNLDFIVNKLINFTINVIDDFKKLENNNKIKNMIKDNCIMLILFSVVLSKEFFSKEYVKEKEKYLPFTIEYIEKLKKNLKKKFKKINNMKDKDEKMKQIVEGLINQE